MDALRFLALGDSYTIGEGVTLQDGWPAQLQHLLNQADHACADPTIIAKTGWTTTDLKNGVQAASIGQSYDLVSLLIGVNNQYQKLDVEIYKHAFPELIQLAIQHAGGRPERVIVLSIPDWSVTPFALERRETVNLASVASEIDSYNKINCLFAYQHGCAYVDVTTITRQHRSDPHAWAGDGLHPAALMYTQWARKIEPILLARL